MPSPPFESLHSALLRVGVSPRYVRRYCAELSDHYRMAVEENRSAGLTPEEATADACRQLGDEGTLFRSVVQQPAVFAFARRRSGITFLLLPIPALYATKTLIVLISVPAGLLASRCAVLSIGWMNLLTPIAHLALDYGAPLAVALLYCMLAHRRGGRPFWPLLSARLLVGRCRDPRVGKDILIGLAASALIAFIILLFGELCRLNTGTRSNLDSPAPEFLQSITYALSGCAYTLWSYGVFGTLMISSVFCLLLVMTRRRVIAAPLLLAIETLVFTTFFNSGVLVVDLGAAAGLAMIVTFLLVPVGLLSHFAFCLGGFCYQLPVSLRGDAWYAAHAYIVAAIILGVAIATYRIACAGQPLLRDETAPPRPFTRPVSSRLRQLGGHRSTRYPRQKVTDLHRQGIRRTVAICSGAGNESGNRV